MPKHYSYRVDHDLGFAPHTEGKLCTVCGCKDTTIEKWAEVGSWVIGIGGNNTGKPNTLLYAMKVESKPAYGDFQQTHPDHAAYLEGHGISPDAPVLVSRNFYYFGDNAKPLPPELVHIIQPTQGCKKVSDGDVVLLCGLVLSHYAAGIHGKPNNETQKAACSTVC